MGAAVKFLKPIKPLTAACLNNAGSPGDPGVGPITKKQKAFDYQDFFYVNGTPIMATAYGLDILAPARWGAAPDLVVSGPNQGQNVGSIVISSGTIANVQFAASRGVPAIALSAGLSTEGEADKSGDFLGWTPHRRQRAHDSNVRSQHLCSLCIEAVSMEIQLHARQ